MVYNCQNVVASGGNLFCSKLLESQKKGSVVIHGRQKQPREKALSYTIARHLLAKTQSLQPQKISICLQFSLNLRDLEA